MIEALKKNQLIEKYSIELLKFSLSGDTDDFWKTYDDLLNLFGYAKIIMNDETLIIKKEEQKCFRKLGQFTKLKISKVDELQKIQRKRFWQRQRKIYDQVQYSNQIYCILTPFNFGINIQRQKINDYNRQPYVFVFNDYVIHSNKLAEKRGIFKGMPSILVKGIDSDVKLIEANQFNHQSKFQEVFDIFKERYKELNPFLNGLEIHFILKDAKNAAGTEQTICSQLSQIVEDIFGIAQIRLFAFVSRNSVICDLMMKHSEYNMLQSYTTSTTVLLKKQDILTHLYSLKLSSLPGISLSRIYFLNQMKIFTISDFLQNLHIIEMITCAQQTEIFMQTCLGFDHRQNQFYLEQKRKQFEDVNLNYDKLFPVIEQGTFEGLKLKTKVQKKREFQQDFEDSIEDVKSERVNTSTFRSKQPKNKTQKNYPKKGEFFPLFGKKGKK